MYYKLTNRRRVTIWYITASSIWLRNWLALEPTVKGSWAGYYRNYHYYYYYHFVCQGYCIYYCRYRRPKRVTNVPQVGEWLTGASQALMTRCVSLNSKQEVEAHLSNIGSGPRFILGIIIIIILPTSPITEWRAVLEQVQCQTKIQF